jgi:hypothetical protein
VPGGSDVDVVVGTGGVLVVVVVGGAGASRTHSPSPTMPLYSVAVLPPVSSVSAVPAASSRRSDMTNPEVLPGRAVNRESAISCAVRTTFHTRISSIWPAYPRWRPYFSAPKTSVGSSPEPAPLG